MSVTRDRVEAGSLWVDTDGAFMPMGSTILVYHVTRLAHSRDCQVLVSSRTRTWHSRFLSCTLLIHMAKLA